MVGTHIAEATSHIEYYIEFHYIEYLLVIIFNTHIVIETDRFH